MEMSVTVVTGETPVAATVFMAVCGALFLAFGVGLWTKARAISEAMRGRVARTGAAPEGFPSVGYVRAFGFLGLFAGLGLFAFVLAQIL
jgi:hypothetical protein